jgi:hypothetical protein
MASKGKGSKVWDIRGILGRILQTFLIILRQRIGNRTRAFSIRSILLIYNGLSVCNRKLLVSIDVDFVPVGAHPGDGEEAHEEVVDSCGDDEAGEVIQVVDVLCTSGDFPADGTGETDDIYQDSANVRRIGAP